MVTTTTGTATVVSGDPNQYEEAQASESIKPGKLLEFGGSNDIQKHSTAGGTATSMFAVEQPLDEGQDRSTATDSGDNLTYVHASTGDRITARAAAENFSDGDYVESNGDGNVRIFSGDSDTISQEVIGVIPPGESFDNSGGSGGEDLVIQIV